MKIIYNKPWLLVTRWRFTQWGISTFVKPRQLGWKRYLRINIGTLSIVVPLWEH